MYCVVYAYVVCLMWKLCVCTCTVMGKWVVTLPSKLMYGILSSTTGFSSIGFLQRRDLFKKTFSTRSSYKHKQALINQMCISKTKTPLFPLQWVFELSLVDAWRDLFILSSIATEIFNFSIHPLMWKEQPPKHREVWRRRWSVAASIESHCLLRCWGSTVLCGVRCWCLLLIVESNILQRLQQINTYNNVFPSDLGKGHRSALVIWT